MSRVHVAFLTLLIAIGCAQQVHAAPSRESLKMSRGEHDASINGLTIHYVVVGHGPLIVVQAPAWGIGSTYLRNGLAPLEEHFTVLTYDPPGSGLSSRPPDGKQMSDAALEDTLDALREYLKLEKFDLVAHSQGGALAIGYAERFPARVRKLVLIGSQLSGYPGAEATQKIQEERSANPKFMAAIARRAEPTPDNDEAYTKHFIDTAAYYFYDPAKSLPVFLKTLTNTLSAWPGHAPPAGEPATPFHEQDHLADIQAKTLVMEGRDDPVCPLVVSQFIHDGISQSQLLIYDQTGHFPWIEHSKDFFADITRFLKQ